MVELSVNKRQGEYNDLMSNREVPQVGIMKEELTKAYEIAD